MTNNDNRIKNGSAVFRLISFAILLQILQVVKSLSIPSQTSISSPFSICLQSPRLSVTKCTSSTLSPERISISRATPSRSRRTLSSPLYASSDDTPGSSSSINKTTELSNWEEPTTPVEDKSGTVVQGEASGDGDGGLLPTYRQLIVFTATTILIWLSEPLLSLVDTTIVGLTASAKSAVVQIAALGPATTLFDSLIYMTYFLAISTTNQLAPRLAAAASFASTTPNEKDETAAPTPRTTNPWKDLRRSTSHLLGLAIVFGSIVTTVTFCFGRSIIGQMVGGAANMGAAEANAIVPLANNYARIRALVAPFSIVGFVSQSFCLTTLDVVTPAIAVAAASIVNIVGDLALSPKYGIQGAAIATALATVTSCSILLRKVRKTTSQWKTKQFEVDNLTKDATTQSAATAAAAADPTTPPATSESSLNKKSIEKDIPFWSIPGKASLIDLFKLAGPIFFVMMAKVACYNLMTVRATNFGIVPLASHNIMMRVFFFFACFGDSLSQAAQTFYPQVDKTARRKFLRRLFGIASIIGLFNNGMSRQILSRWAQFLTKDSNIMGLMSTYAPWVGCAVLLHPFIMLLEGIVLARRDLFFMIGSYTLTSLLHFSFVFSPGASTFAGLWRALFGFQVIRLVQFASRVSQRSRATSKNPIPAPPL